MMMSPFGVLFAASFIEIIYFFFHLICWYTWMIVKRIGFACIRMVMILLLIGLKTAADLLCCCSLWLPLHLLWCPYFLSSSIGVHLFQGTRYLSIWALKSQVCSYSFLHFFLHTLQFPFIHWSHIPSFKSCLHPLVSAVQVPIGFTSTAPWLPLGRKVTWTWVPCCPLVALWPHCR